MQTVDPYRLRRVDAKKVRLLAWCELAIEEHEYSDVFRYCREYLEEVNKCVSLS